MQYLINNYLVHFWTYFAFQTKLVIILFQKNFLVLALSLKFRMRPKNMVYNCTVAISIFLFCFIIKILLASTTDYVLLIEYLGWFDSSHIINI